MKFVISTYGVPDYMFCTVIVIVIFLPRTCITLSDELRYVEVRLEMASESEIVNKTR